jgi:peptide/nickel transport system permease protein
VSTETIEAESKNSFPYIFRPGSRLRDGSSAILHFSRRKPLGAFGGFIVALVIFVAVFAPLIAPADPYTHNPSDSFSAPSLEYLAGTDIFGRDQLSRIIYGSRVSLFVGFASVIIGTSIGMLIGIASAFLGGKFDLVVQRFVDTMMGFPGLVLVLVMVVALGPSLLNVTLAIAFNYFDKVIRLARSSALSVKEEPYILAATAVGVSTWRIIWRHVTPNSLAPVFVLATQQLGTAIVIEAGLSFLGLGVQPPNPSWGNMLQSAARGNMELTPWLAIYPGVALALVVFAFAVFGDALRDVLDPRMRGT